MKKTNLLIKRAFAGLFAALLLLNACKKEDELFEKTRLFRPVLNEDLFSEENAIIVDMGNLKEAVSYTVELSRDTFQTVELKIETDTSYLEITDLLWNTIYQVRATAHAADSAYDSKISDFGSVRTQRFPSILGIPGTYDVTDVAARLFWTTAGAPVTGVKVFARSDEKLEEPLLELDLTTDDQQAEMKIVPGLEPSTEYQIALYSQDNLRGWENYTTRPALPVGDGVVDLRGINKESILADTLPDIAGGSIVLLESGFTYETGGHQFDKSVSIRSAYGFIPGGAIINCGSNFNLKDGSSVDSVVFRGVTLTGDMGGNYVFNIDQSGSLAALKFESCRIRKLRGIVRMKGGSGALSEYSFNNCIIDSIGGYGLITVDKEEWSVGDMIVRNSTISKAESFIVSKSNSTSIVLDACTISEAPKQGSRIFRYRTGGADNVTGGITISNCIWGHGWDPSESGSTAVVGFEGLGSTNFNIVNTYATSDFAFSSDPIAGFPSFAYTGTATDLWVAPGTGNFNFKDGTFAGKGDSGDPRWRIGL